MQNILVTGGSGFIGTNLIIYLTSKGFTCRILDNFTNCALIWRNNEKYPAASLHTPLQIQDFKIPVKGKEINAHLIIGDILDERAVVDAVEGIDVIVHLAALGNVADSLKNPRQCWDVNVNGTLNMLEACRKAGVSKFIFASSNAAVGEQLPPINEMQVSRPISPYGAAKAAGEALCHAYCQSFGLNTTSLRFANCYGPYSEHKTSVIGRYCTLLEKGEPLVIYGDGNQTRDFIYVDDVCQAIYKASIADQSSGEVIQVASGVGTSINELIRLLSEVTNRDIDAIRESGRKGDIRKSYSDISKAEKILGYKPTVSLYKGLKSLWDYRYSNKIGL